MTDRALMQQALEALELEATRTPIPETAAAIEALRARLAEPEPEPVAWMESPHGAIRANPLYKHVFPSQLLHWQVPLYTTPPQLKPLTDEEIDELPWCPSFENPMTLAEGLRHFARAIERAHNITGGNDE